MNRLLPPALVLVVWLALWGEVTWANVISGMLAVLLIGLLMRPVPRSHRIHLFALIRLLAVFVGRLVTSSMTVVRTVLAPTPARLRSGVVGVPLKNRSQMVATVLADAISLTPGTLTLDARVPEVDPSGKSQDRGGVNPVLYIHVLGLGDPEDVRSDVRKLEAMVVAAVTPLEAAVEPPTPERGSS